MVTVYRRLRTDFLKVLHRAFWWIFNYQSQDGVGLTITRIDMASMVVRLQRATVELLGNPFGLSIENCEQEAEGILDAMIFPGPLAETTADQSRGARPANFVCL